MDKKSNLKKYNRKKNPYNTGSEARGADFFDRENILLEVSRFIDNDKEYNLTVFGQRRIGKTSLLRKIQDEFDDIDPIYFDLQDRSKIPIEKLICDIALKVKIELELKFDIDVSKLESDSGRDYFADVFLKKVFDEKRNKKKLVFLFDEFDTIGDMERIEGDIGINNMSYNQFIPFILFLIDKIKMANFPVKFVFAVGRNYKDLDPNRYGQILRFGSQCELSYFSKDQCIKFIGNLSKKYIKFKDNALQYLYELGFGHPMFSVCIASVASEYAAESNRKIVTKEVIINSLDRALKKYGYAVYWIFDSLSNREKIILYIIALINEHGDIADFNSIEQKAYEINFGPAVMDLQNSLDKLRKFGFIFCDYKHGYTFYVEFIRKWFVSQIYEDFEKFLEEAGRDDKLNLHITNAKYFYYNEKDWLKAAEHYESILKYYPYHFEALINCAKCYEQMTSKYKKYFKLAFVKYHDAYKLNTAKTEQSYLNFLNDYLKYAESKDERKSLVRILSEIISLDKKDFKAVQKLAERLIIDRKDFTGIPNYKNITELKLKNKNIDQLPENIGNFEDLELLDIRDNNIKDLPTSIFKLEKLKKLFLAGNPLSIYEGFVLEDKESVFDFFIIKKMERILGEKLERLDKLKYPERGYVLKKDGRVAGLAVFVSNIKNFKRIFLYLKNLKELSSIDLSNNSLIDYSFLKDLEMLYSINLQGNKLSDVSFLKSLKKISYLNLSNNKLNDISFLKNLRNLTYLDLSGNNIDDISSLQNLEKLNWVNLAGNNIKKIPEWLVDSNLEISLEINEIPDFCFINLYNNPISDPPIEIVRHGKQAIKDYFNSVTGKEKVKLNEIKVLLVGDGGVGKTSLMKRLMGEEFDKNEPQTHGIKIREKIVNIKEEDVKIRFWDFGGQQIMHATHQFFLSKRSLYILVLDGRKEEDAEHWLKLIESFGGSSPVLVVMNKIDSHPDFEVDRLFLKNKYKTVKGFFRTSCKENKGLANLKSGINEALLKIEHLNTEWIYNWFKVKTMLENIKEPFIDYNLYISICKEQRVEKKADQDMLAEYLNDLGIILHFKDLELLDTHVLEPKWVTEGVYRIITSERLAESKGLLKLKWLADILKTKKEYSYPPSQYQFIINLMKKFELCYIIDTETVLIPDLLERQTPEFDFDYENSLKFFIQYDFLPKSIIPRFIVQMHKDIKDGLQWRTGVVLHDKDFACSAVVYAEEREKKIYINVCGERKRDYFAVIRSRFLSINKSFEKLEAVEKVPMPDNSKVSVSYDHLCRLEAKGKKDYMPDGSEKEYKVMELLGSIVPEKRTEDEILEIVRKLEKIMQPDDVNHSKTKGLLEELDNLVELKPSLFGFNIDVKRIFKKILE